ncbi:MAG: phosphate ABC transporter permease PstA [Clostridiaceae bacterium]|nr:phosphate ABC transporter permease PstA [Clostridiaceae bacterium]
MKKLNFRKTEGMLLRVLVNLAAATTLACFIGIVGYIIVKGIGSLSPDMFSFEYNSENMSLLPSLINTLIITVLAILISAPIGIFGAVYLVEYAKTGGKLAELFRLTAETLSGIPSIVYGLFGMLFFVFALGWDYSILAGAFTVAIMVLPVIIRTTEEALKAVPIEYREASFGLGAGKVRTIFKIVLPTAIPGILSGIILSIGRIVGETAALRYTAGTVASLPNGIMDSGSTLSVFMYKLAGEGLHIDKAYATAVVLLVTVLVINSLSSLIAKKLRKGL